MSPNMQYGIPFILTIILSSYGLREFTQIRYDIKEKYGAPTAVQEAMARNGIPYEEKEEKRTMSEFYDEMVKDKDIDSWSNKRVPRPSENE